jgi:hypothetical protein
LPEPPFSVAPILAAVSTMVSWPLPPFTVSPALPTYTVAAPDPRLMMSLFTAPKISAGAASIMFNVRSSPLRSQMK